MENKHRITALSSSLLLLLAFVFPVWQVKLVAPQYLEGINLYIYVNKLTGDIQNYDILNHYIGMAPMPTDLIEFKLFPIGMIVFIVLGVICAYFGRWYKWWIGLVIVCLLVAGVDFYQHLYEHSHNLDPKAPIKIEGMEYTPPIIGTKRILNFTATALPHIGSLSVLLSLVGMLVANKLKNK